MNSPILAYPQERGRFIVDADASQFAVGGVLSQEQEGAEKVIAYYSKSLSRAEKNYCVTRKELLAIVKAFASFHKYLYGREFLLRTDHASLKWLMDFKNPEGQVARWLEGLQEYNFKIEYRKGTHHGNADALSRRPCPHDCRHCMRLEEKENTLKVRETIIISDTWPAETIRQEQGEDPDLSDILPWKRKGQRPAWQEVSDLGVTVKCYWAQWDTLHLVDGPLYRKWESPSGRDSRLQLIVPQARIPEVLQEMHGGTSGGHLGVNKTLEKVRQRFYWVRCRMDVEKWCRSCRVCMSVKGPQKRTRGAMRSYNVGSPFERIAVDVVGPFPRTELGNRFILVAMDYFSKWPEAYPIPNQEARTVAEVLFESWVCRYGVPLQVHSDQGRNFESKLLHELCAKLGMAKTRTTPLHCQSDGMVERLNRTMENYLAKMVQRNQLNWDKLLPPFLLAYRSARHDSTGQSPSRVVFGRELRLPSDLRFGCPQKNPAFVTEYVQDVERRLDEIHKLVRGSIRRASDRMKTRYDVRANASGYMEGELVWLYSPHRKRGLSPKLQAAWDGPYAIVKRLNDVVYRIRKVPHGRPKVVHIDRLSKYFCST